MHDASPQSAALDAATVAAAVREADALPGARCLLVRWQDGRLRLTLHLAADDPGADALAELLRDWVAAPTASAASTGVPAPASLPSDPAPRARGGLFLL
jgi:hypothetical protein